MNSHNTPENQVKRLSSIHNICAQLQKQNGESVREAPRRGINFSIERILGDSPALATSHGISFSIENILRSSSSSPSVEWVSFLYFV